MKRDIQRALDEVEMTYEELNQVAVEMTSSIFEDINKTIKAINTDALFSLSNDELRELMLKLSLMSYSLADIKDKASMKNNCAETIKKIKYAEQFNCTEGSVAFRENSALINSSEEVLTELVYDLVSSLFKTKLDEIHRIVDVLKTILMSKMQEIKMVQNLSVGEVNETTYLKE